MRHLIHVQRHIDGHFAVVLDPFILAAGVVVHPIHVRTEEQFPEQILNIAMLFGSLVLPGAAQRPFSHLPKIEIRINDPVDLVPPFPEARITRGMTSLENIEGLVGTSLYNR